MTTVDVTALVPARAEYLTLINVCEIPPKAVDAFIEGWTERAKIISMHQGFRDSRLHCALTPDGRFQLINVAHWDSAESYESARKDLAFRYRSTTSRKRYRKCFRTRVCIRSSAATPSRQM